jgi:hypothetical protein
MWLVLGCAAAMFGVGFGARVANALIVLLAS